jgi:ABC-type branched-subunit amino acid transport system substrate-binding protein
LEFTTAAKDGAPALGTGSYEGEELSKNVFYTGAAPNQQAIPAVEYLLSLE